ATKCISEVPGLVKHTLTPPATSVRARLSAPFIDVSSGSVAVVERGHDGLRGHQIEMSAARVLEEGDVVGAEPSRHPAADQVVEIAPHVLPPDRAARDRRQDVADPVEGGLEAVDEDAAAAGRFVVGLARVLGVATEQVQGGAGLEPRAPDERRVRGGARGGAPWGHPPSMSGVCVRVAEEMTWACRTAAARSAVASAATPSARSA